MAIKMENKTFPSSDKSTGIVYTRWFDDGVKPKAILLIAHGMAEHVGRYDDFARFMVERGYAVYGNDHLGHGKTAKPEDRGWFGEKDGRRNVVEDIRTLLRTAKGDFPGVRVLLLGHSMGSFLSRLFCMSYSAEIDGAIFMGTSGRNPLSGLGVLLANLLALFRGGRHRSPFFAKLSTGSYNARFRPSRTESDWLSTDEAEVQKVINDELCGFLFTVSGYRELCKMLVEINRKGWAAGIRKDLPVLLISGEEDPVGAFGAGVREVYRGLKAAGLGDLTLYPGMRHEVLNEKDKQRAYDDLLAWCDERTGAK